MKGGGIDSGVGEGGGRLESPEVITCLCDCKVEKGFQEGERMQRPTNDIGIAREVESRVSKEDACQLHRL